MKYTEEQIKTAKELLDLYCNQNKVMPMSDFLDSLLKPGREKFFIEIEQDRGRTEMSESMILQALANGFDSRRNISVKKLPEVFTREDMIKFKYGMINDANSIFWNHQIENFLSERKSK